MTRLDNLERAIKGLESNISRLQRDNHKRESSNCDIYYKWIHYRPGSSSRCDMELHTDMLVTECNNCRIIDNERHLKAQLELHTKLLYIYGVMLKGSLDAIFKKN
jgi:hypothetical protein